MFAYLFGRRTAKHWLHDLGLGRLVNERDAAIGALDETGPVLATALWTPHRPLASQTTPADPRETAGMRARLLVVLGGVLVLCGGTAMFLALWGGGPERTGGVVPVDISDLRPNSAKAVAVTLPDKKLTKARIFVVRRGAHQVHAFLGVSTHLGCRLLLPGDPRYGRGFTRTSRRYVFEDPCGGSVYALNGDCTGGPCPRALDRYRVEVNDDSAEVDLNHLTKGPPRVTQSAARA